MSVQSRGRYVPRPAPLTSRKLKSPRDLKRRRPLARPIQTGPPHRSMFASTTRPIRHNTPLSLSIVARPHEAGLLGSWRADSFALVWLDPGITPCCKTPKMFWSDFSAKRATKRQSTIDVSSSALPKLPVSSSPVAAVPPHDYSFAAPQPGTFVFSDPKRVLQHYPSMSRHRQCNLLCQNKCQQWHSERRQRSP
jgi:hypothetical protein